LLSETFGRPRRLPKNLHVFMADWNVGPLKGMPWMVKVVLPADRTTVMPSPPGLAVGSGKLGTPWERMHCERASGGGGLDEAAGTVVEPPQAVIAVTLIRAASAIGMVWR
jgi:hypothetical protein